MRFAAVFGLNANSDAGFKLIEESLKDEDPGVRIMAATKLAGVSSTRAEVALKALESLANDKDAEVRARWSTLWLPSRPDRAAGELPAQADLVGLAAFDPPDSYYR